MSQVDYPFSFDTRGRTSDTTADDHIRDLIEQILFTSPGERVNRPTFGCGLNQLVFAPNSPELAAALHRLRATLARLKAELELAEIDGEQSLPDRLPVAGCGRCLRRSDRCLEFASDQVDGCL